MDQVRDELGVIRDANPGEEHVGQNLRKCCLVHVSIQIDPLFHSGQPTSQEVRLKIELNQLATAIPIPLT